MADGHAMVVTKIERQKRHPQRVNIFLDDAFAFGIHDAVLVKAGIARGDRLTDDDVQRLQTLEESKRARERAMRLLSHRLRSEKELRTRLLEQEYPPIVIDEVIQQLREDGLINDAEFARSYIHDLQLRKPAGRRLLQRQLLLKGVLKQVADEILEEAVPEGGEQALALEAAMKLISRAQLRPLTTEKQRQRVTQFLLRRGFAWPTISPVLKTLFPSSTSSMQE